MKILAVLYSGGLAAKEEPRLLGTVENEVSRWPQIARKQDAETTSSLVSANGWRAAVMSTL